MTTGNSNLISAADVSGTNVYGADDSKVGAVDRVMIDKQSGKVAYAVMNFGGVLGIGGDERPLPRVGSTMPCMPPIRMFRGCV